MISTVILIVILSAIPLLFLSFCHCYPIRSSNLALMDGVKVQPLKPHLTLT